jgi:hypothetical protein
MTAEDSLHQLRRQNRVLKVAAFGLAGLALGAAALSLGLIFAPLAVPAPPPEALLVGQWRGVGEIEYDALRAGDGAVLCPDKVVGIKQEPIDVWAVYWSDQTLSWLELHKKAFAGPRKTILLPGKVLPARLMAERWEAVRSGGDGFIIRMPAVTPEEVTVRFAGRDRIELRFRCPARGVGELMLPPGTVKIRLARDVGHLSSDTDPLAPGPSGCCPWSREDLGSGPPRIGGRRHRHHSTATARPPAGDPAAEVSAPQ